MEGINIKIGLDVSGLESVADVSTALVHVAKEGVNVSGALDKLDGAQAATAASTAETKGQFDEMVAVLGDIRTALTQTVTALQALSKDGAETAAAIDNLGNAQNTATAACLTTSQKGRMPFAPTSPPFVIFVPFVVPPPATPPPIHPSLHR